MTIKRNNFPTPALRDPKLLHEWLEAQVRASLHAAPDMRLTGPQTAALCYAIADALVRAGVTQPEEGGQS
jgi:hypothetical protein